MSRTGQNSESPDDDGWEQNAHPCPSSRRTSQEVGAKNHIELSEGERSVAAESTGGKYPLSVVVEQLDSGGVEDPPQRTRWVIRAATWEELGQV